MCKNRGKHAFVTATLGRTLVFEVSDIKILQQLGYTVHCAADFTQEPVDDFQLPGIIRHQTGFARNPFSLSNIKAYVRSGRLLSRIRPQLVHCHTPVAGVITRLAAGKYRKHGAKVFYTAHGFHFYHGAPFRNWLLFYPVEWLLSFRTDVLITINREDYRRAAEHMHAGETVYIPGVGIDTAKFRHADPADAKRRGPGAADSESMLQGEPGRRKNNQPAARALPLSGRPDVGYFTAGCGVPEPELKRLVHKPRPDQSVTFPGGGLREQMNIPEDALLLVSVGELNRNKNHRTVIRALAELNDADIHYVIAGTGAYEGRLRRLIRVLKLDGRVHLAGFRNDVDRLYRCGDVCVFPSLREGLGRAAIEGMAAGLPLICSASRGSLEYARHMDNAIVCRPENVREWRRAIQFLAAHPDIRAQMGRKNRRRALKFDQKNVREKMTGLYQSV